MKYKLAIALGVSISLLAGCGADDTSTSDASAEETTDVVTTASIVNEGAAFIDAVSADGNWIVATLNDLTIDEEVVVAGEFHDKGDEANDVYRKIAPYTQDDDHNITDSFTITVPKLTVQSENLRFQGGTLKGDVVVEANGFNLDASAAIDGNLYFANEEVRASAAIDGEVTGSTELASVDTDVVTTASIVNEAEAFVNAVSENGTWIIATLNDLTIDEEVVVAGEFHDKGDAANDVYRKIAPYTQDDDHNITDSFTITVPKLTVQSENLRFQGGTLKGDVVVEANGFNLDASATIDGNLYFANEDVEASAVIDGDVTGSVEVQ